MAHPRDEVLAAVDRYRSVREAIDRGEQQWTALADMFTDDAVYIDVAWGRVEGIAAIRAFLEESMVGLDDWSFPVEFTAVEGDDVVIKWHQQLPGTRADGSRYQQSGYSRLVYGGDGRFRYEEDVLNMVHLYEDMKTSGWAPAEGFNPPPGSPDRDYSLPPA
jgi:ketosteroid isomerase-like protein